MSDYDAFTGGVDPGGLRNKNDIKILVCYILQSVNSPLYFDDVLKIMQEKSLANYFETSDAISSLLKNGNIEKDKNGLLRICETGLEIAQTLDTTLPLSVRDKALEAAVVMLSYAKNERENQVEITKLDKGFSVDLHISDGKRDLMNITLYAPNKKQAKMIKGNFHKNPSKIYRLMLSALTGDDELLKKLFSED